MRMLIKSFLSITVLMLSLSLANVSQAQQVTGTWDITPPPVNGAYEPGQVINVCYTLSYFLNGGGNNWLHGIVIDFPPGWDVSSITNTSVPPTSPGIWVWMPDGVTASNNNGLSWGPGFYYDANSGGGTLNGNPGDNWGVSAATLPPNYTFCFDITVGTNIADGGCGGPGNPLDGNDITPRIQITGDAESGSWNGPIPPEAGSTSPNPVIINCCDAESGIPPATDVIICENGIMSLIDLLGDPIDDGGSWSGPAGWTDASGAAALGTFDPLTDPPGEYTYLVYGTDNCESTTTINMVYNDFGQLGTLTYCHDYTSPITQIVSTSAAVNITVPPGGTWYNPAGDPVTNGILNPAAGSNTPAGLYTYRYYDGGNCPSSFQVHIHYASGGAAGSPSTVDHCTSDGCFSPFDALGGDPIIGGSWYVYKTSVPGAAGYLANLPLWNACLDLTTFAATHNYEGDLRFHYMLDAYPCEPGNVPVTVQVHWPANTGESANYSICESDAPVDLLPLLNGTPDPGYEWSDEDGNVISNILDPSDYTPNTTKNFFYTGGFEGTSCYSGAYVQVTFLPENAY